MYQITYAVVENNFTIVYVTDVKNLSGITNLLEKSKAPFKVEQAGRFRHLTPEDFGWGGYEYWYWG